MFSTSSSSALLNRRHPSCVKLLPRLNKVRQILSIILHKLILLIHPALVVESLFLIRAGPANSMPKPIIDIDCDNVGFPCLCPHCQAVSPNLPQAILQGHCIETCTIWTTPVMWNNSIWVHTVFRSMVANCQIEGIPCTFGLDVIPVASAEGIGSVPPFMDGPRFHKTLAHEFGHKAIVAVPHEQNVPVLQRLEPIARGDHGRGGCLVLFIILLQGPHVVKHIRHLGGILWTGGANCSVVIIGTWRTITVILKGG
mmetsp:Transcript_19365/g.53246  ORF Transcript_19365/g.53246 Transcript_19365/m.53246 type:complete len:255 (+) Transcript_19365:101-865(+)